MLTFSPFYEYVQSLVPNEFWRFRELAGSGSPSDVDNEAGVAGNLVRIHDGFFPFLGRYNIKNELPPATGEGYPSLHFDPMGNDLSAIVVDESQKDYFRGSVNASIPLNGSNRHFSFLIRTPSLFKTSSTVFSFVPLASKTTIGGGDEKFTIAIVGTKLDVMLWSASSGFVRRENTTVDLESFQTYFLTVVFTGEGDADEIKLYVNGVKCNTLISQGSASVSITSSTLVYIGNGHNYITDYDIPTYSNSEVVKYAPLNTVFDEIVYFDEHPGDPSTTIMAELALGTNALDEIALTPIVNRYPVISTHGVGVPISNTVEFIFSQTDSSRKQFSFTQEYLQETKAQSQFVQSITDVFASARAELSFAQNIRLASQTILAGNIDIRVGNQIVIRGDDITELSKQVTMAQDILAINKVRAQTVLIHILQDATAVISITDQPAIHINGRKINIGDADVSIDENSLGWNARVTLSDINDYSQFKQDEEFELNLFGEIWNLIVDSKELGRSDVAEYQATISAVSPVFRHDSPRAKSLDMVWETQSMAHSIAQEAIDDSIIWTTVDWPISANLVSVKNGSPISVVKNLADTAGAIITSDPDGTIRVQPKHIVDVPDYFAQSANQTYTEDADIFRISESFVAGRVVNNICIMDSDGSIEDSIEFIADPDDVQHGVLRVYPVPWREKEEFQLKLTDTSGRVALNVGQPHERSRTESSTQDTWLLTEGDGELIEIAEGTGSANYPIDAIINIDWLSDVIGLAFNKGEKEFLSTHVDSKYGLVRLKYTVRYYEYDIRNVQDFDEVQAVLVDLRDI